MLGLGRRRSPDPPAPFEEGDEKKHHWVIFRGVLPRGAVPKRRRSQSGEQEAERRRRVELIIAARRELEVPKRSGAAAFW